MANTYDIGDTVKLQVTFETAEGVAVDPTAIVLKVQDPDGTETTYTYALGQVLKSATGVYYYYVVPDESGTWHYNWAGTGTVVSATEGFFYVRTSEF